MTNLKPYVVTLMAGILGGYLLFSALLPKPKPEIQVVEKIVEKIVTKVDTHVVTRDIIKPDGTHETVIVADSHTATVNDLQTATSIKTTNPFQYRYKVSPMLGYSFTANRQTYGAMVEKYLLPGLTVGLYAFPLEKNGGLTVGLSF